jgi:tetratricopeptide (TPR) repeat protein
MDRPISVQNVNGNVTVTIVEGNNNQTQVTIGDFIEKTKTECGLRLIYEDTFKENNNTTSNFNEWLKGFPLDLKSIYHNREYRREKLIDIIKKKLEDKQRLLLLGVSGTSKSTLVMEILCDYLKKGYKILHNLDPTASGEIKNLEYLENTLSLLVKDNNNVIVIVDNVHNKSISNIFSLIHKIKNDHEDKLDKIRFLLSARQPEFGWAMDRGIFDSDTIEKIDMLFDEEKKYDIPYFTEVEVKDFVEKYKEYLHPFKRNKSVEEIAQEIFTDTKGYPIMVRFSVLQDGLKTHVKRMYTDYLIQKDGESNSPNTERIKSVIACSLYDISSIPLKEESLLVDLDLEIPSLEIVDTIIKKSENFWTTIHPRWDLELFKYIFSLNEADRTKVKKTFSFILNKILDINGRDINDGSFKQLDILNTLYNTIAAEQFIDIKIIQEMVKEDDIENKLGLFFIPEFYNIIGRAYNKLKQYENAIMWFNKNTEVMRRGFGVSGAYYNKGVALSALGRYEEAIECYDIILYRVKKDPVAYYNKGVALSALGRYEEAIECYDKAIEITPQYVDAYYNKGTNLLTLGRKEEALDSFTTFLKYDSKNLDGLLGKANSLIQLNKMSEAKSLIDKVLSIYPNNEFVLKLKKMIE